jgi:hypothetical protein
MLDIEWGEGGLLQKWMLCRSHPSIEQLRSDLNQFLSILFAEIRVLIEQN